MCNKNKFFAWILFTVMLASCFGANAMAAETIYNHTPYIDDELFCEINNEYYSVYKEQLFENSVEAYREFIKENKADEIQGKFLDSIQPGQCVCATIIFATTANSHNTDEINEQNATELFPEEDILYISEKSPAVTVRLDYDKIDKVQSSDDVLFINEAFFSKQPELSITVEGKYLMGDVFDSYLENPIPDYDYSAHSVTAADARLVMRFAAGIENKNQTKRFYFTADMDLDGKITSADARMILRTAAGLEDEKYIKYDCMNMWYDFGNAE